MPKPKVALPERVLLRGTPIFIEGGKAAGSCGRGCPDSFNGATVLGFENHLNLFHENKRGLPQALARGLAVFFNSTIVDDNFRRFSGHTQVNATDLKQMKYPSRAALIELGEWAMQPGELTQTLIDEKLGTLTA